MVFLAGYLLSAAGGPDPIAKKYQGKVTYASKQYQNEVKKIKYAMLKEYQSLLSKKMNEGDLDTANDIQKKIDYLKGKSDDNTILGMDFTIPDTGLEPAVDSTKNINVALEKNGGKVLVCQVHGEMLIDGNATDYNEIDGFGYSIIPCQIDFEFSEVYKLSYIQFLLWDQNDRFYRYTIETSVDGKKWEKLIDRSEGKWRSWQQIEFKPKNIKYVRINGLYNSINNGFHIVEFEAYPRKPDKVPEPKWKSEK